MKRRTQTNMHEDGQELLDGLLFQAVKQLQRDMEVHTPPSELDATLLRDLQNGTLRHPASRTSLIRWVGPLGALAACVLLVIGLASFFVAGASPALAQTRDALRRVQTVSFTIVQTFTDEKEDVFYVKWLGDKLGRVELPNGSYIVFDAEAKRMLEVNPQASTATITEDLPVPGQFSLLSILSAAKSHMDIDAPAVPDREIGGVSASGFSITLDGLRYDIWIDTATHLPLQMQTQNQRKIPDGPSTFKEQNITEVWTDFRFDESLDQTLFSLQPPDGTVVSMRKASSNSVEGQKQQAEQEFKKAQEAMRKR